MSGIQAIIQKQVRHSFSRRNLWIGLKSFLHGAVAIALLRFIPPHDWQVAAAGGLAYGAIMHYLFHSRDNQTQQ